MNRSLPVLLSLAATVALAATFTRHAAIAGDQASTAARGATSTPARFRSLPPLDARAAAAVFAQRDSVIEARFTASPRARGTANVELPTRADGPFHVTDSASRLDVSVAWRDAPSLPASLVAGGVAYTGALDAPAVLHRVSPFGTEDFVAFASAPSEEVLRYDVELGASVAGLRLVEGTLELLDASGAPRLRASAPYGIDAHGSRFAATLAVRGCAVDTSPVAPWGRPVTVPSARRCEVDVSWHGAAYPLIVDPGWMSTHVMNVARSQHAGALLMNGQVLVSGGQVSAQNPMYGRSAELYDAQSGTWATTGSMTDARGAHTVTALPDGSAVAVGGDGDPSAATTAEAYDPTSGGWTLVGQLHDRRTNHTATVLNNGKVLVAGGFDSMGAGLATAELYNPTSQIWATTGSMPSGCNSHSATLLTNGKVLVAGGDDMVNTPITTTALYDVTSGMWTAGNPMNDPRAYHTASLLPDGRVLAAGGYAGGSTPASYLASSELFDPMTGVWTETGLMPERHYGHGAVLLASGQVLVAGGGDSGGSVAATSLFDPAAGAWTSAGDMATARVFFVMSNLPDGDALASGGNDGVSQFIDTCELYAPTATGAGGSGGGATTGPSGSTTSTGSMGGSTTGPATTSTGAGQGGSTSSSGMACVPGEQVACACPGGSQGVQDCNASGDGYGMCTGCPDAGTAPADDTGSSGGCGCRIGEGDDAPRGLLFAAVAALCAAAARRRRQRA